MKTGLRTVMTLKVPVALFVLACAALVGVAIGARMVAEDISTIDDATIQMLSTVRFCPFSV
jgi:hypothetical protein